MEKITERYSRQEWTALDILRLPEDLVSNADKLWLVLREELIDAPILHEFACRCAERALFLIDNPDSRSVAAVAAKRAWLKGDITDRQLDSACDAAYDAACAATRGTTVSSAAYSAYWAADNDAYSAAGWAACDAVYNAEDTAAERAWQVEALIKMLEVNDQL